MVGGSFQASSGFELHKMSMDGDVMQMRPTGPLEIPAGSKLTLDPMATHIMFTGLKRGLKKGETVDGTLVFERAGTVPVSFEVEGIGAKAPAKVDAAGHAGHSMPGMDMDLAGAPTMSNAVPLDAAPASPSARSSLYRAIWRWHFYAGLISVPFMILLAVTGSIYLFKNEINHTAFAYRNVVQAQATPMQPPSRLTEEALAALPGARLKSYAEPASPTASALVTLKGDGGKTLVYLNPYTGQVLDTVNANTEFMFVARKLHSLVYFGDYASYVIEAVGGFALILVVTGFYLWWPRRQAGGVVTVRGTPTKRIWWRDVHAVTGAFAGVVIFFLAATGMPWSKFWGAHMQDYANTAGVGYPAKLWDDVPSSTVPMSEATTKPGWVMETAPVPASTPTGTAPIGLDRAVDEAHKLGITRGFEMSVPGDETGVYTAAIYPADLGKERTIHFDQYTGKPLVDIAFKDYGPIGKAIEFGINVHMGQEFGLLNQIVMLATCLAIILSSVAAVVMWWKRRPVGRVGVPPYPAESRVYRALWIAAAALGLAFPITGAAILLMLAVDLLVIRTVPPLRRAFA